MYFLSQTLHVCYFSMLIRLINGYVLFAANLDDFHALAKKLVPGTLADSLRSMASKISVRQDESTDFDENSDESEGDNESLSPIKGAKEKHAPIRGSKSNHKTKEIYELEHGTKVDFEELVERVKKRLALEINRTYLDKIRKDLNLKTKRIEFNNDKESKVEKSKKNVAKPKKQNKKKQKDRFSTEEMSPFANEPDYTEDNKKSKERNAKISKDDKYNENVAKPKKQNDQFNIEEMSTFGAMPEEDISNRFKIKPEIKTVSETDDHKDAMKLALKESNTGNKKINSGKKNRDKVIKKLKPHVTLTTIKSYDLYKKLDMTQKDSYEDYVTPAKENKVFISTESREKNTVEDHSKHKYNPYKKRYRIESNRQSFHPFNDRNSKTRHGKPSKHPLNDNSKPLNNEYLKTPNNEDLTEKPIGSDEIKAKTEDMWYKNDKKVTGNIAVLPEISKSNLGTKLPRRHTYKMATPNYLSNLPVVAEKYDFDEPLPERDRERENLKYVGNPPASINKKVLL